jgi:hypothetical protein
MLIFFDAQPTSVAVGANFGDVHGFGDTNG